VARIDVPIRDLFSKTLSLQTGSPATVSVQGLAGKLVEMEDAHFHFDSAVMLPVAPTQDGNDLAPPEKVSGLAVLAAVLDQAAGNPDDSLLIAGHTDTSGEATGNLELSSLRAQSVLHALTGNRDEWARIADQRHRVLDIQLVLKWAAQELDWDCDPVELDDQMGPHTTTAIQQFQGAYNEEYDPDIAVDGDFGPKTWGAVFDLYMYVLADLLNTDEDGLAQRQQALKFVDDGQRTVGCGENHPIEAAGRDNFRSATNRRVELLFFTPGNEPQLPCHPGDACNPELCEIYTKKLFAFEFLQVQPFPTGTLNITLLDDRRAPMPNQPFRLRIAGAEITGNADANAIVTQDNVALPPTCELAWGDLDTKPGARNADPAFRFQRTLHIRVRAKSARHRNQQAHRRLQNLGYVSDIVSMASAFQNDFQKPGGAWFDQPTYDEVLSTHDGGQPAPPDPDDDGQSPAEVARAERESDGTNVA
jgi:outer membrane protein OmpA-like peptidoglycan-associated protein